VDANDIPHHVGRVRSVTGERGGSLKPKTNVLMLFIIPLLPDHSQIPRVAEVRFSLVLAPNGENLEPDLNLAGYLVKNHEPEPQNRFYQVRSTVQAGLDLKKSFKFPSKVPVQPLAPLERHWDLP